MTDCFARKNSRKAFTLAEVLITLGIIGIVAAMTIPTLMNNTKNKQTIVATKKAYSELLQAKKLIEVEEGGVEGWIPDVGTAGDIALASLFAAKMNVIKNCTQTGIIDCVGTSYKYLNGATFPYVDNTTKQTLILNDGSSLIFGTFGSGGSSAYGAVGSELATAYGDVYVDINGPKKPNVIGEDVFSFFITKNTLIPYGSQQVSSIGFDVATCRKDASGHGCAAWVLNKENMDYLNCKTGSEPVCSTIHW